MCEFCQNHEQGDTLYEPSDWDGGIGFDYIRDIKYCPLCGRKLDSEDEPTTQTETQNSNLTFEKRTMLDCYNCKYFCTENCRECHYEPKDEPTISKMEQVEDEPMKTTDYCDICKRDMCEVCVADATNPYCVPSHYEIKQDEPQTTSTPYNIDTSSICKIESQTEYKMPYEDCEDCETHLKAQYGSSW